LFPSTLVPRKALVGDAFINASGDRMVMGEDGEYHKDPSYVKPPSQFDPRF
jgi:hypothetical protein